MSILGNMSSVSLVAVLLVLSLFASLTTCKKGDTRLAGKRHCTKQTGKDHNSITDIKWRNDKYSSTSNPNNITHILTRCAIDCIFEEGLVVTLQLDESGPCKKKGRICTLGACRKKSVKPKGLLKVSIDIYRAYVEDKDEQHRDESDVYIDVQVVRGGVPMYPDNSHVCSTHVVHDSNKPDWGGFRCKPLPMLEHTVLRFSAYDHDEPHSDNEILGSAEQDLSDLVNAGKTKLTLVHSGPRGLYSRYYVEVEVKSGAQVDDRY